jgi:hypothetical protein
MHGHATPSRRIFAAVQDGSSAAGRLDVVLFPVLPVEWPR